MVLGGRHGRSLPERRLAVDLGTANTVVYRSGEGVVAFEPSVVALDDKTGAVLAVGSAARRMVGRTPGHIRAIRPLRHGVIADFDVTEQMLRYFIGRAGRIRRGAQVMVCVPSGVTQVERSAVEEAVLAAGASRAFLIEEPLAAAIGAGLRVGESVGSMIVDVGGGTSEVAVTALGSLVVAHSIKTGGYDLDDAIVRLVQDVERLLIGQEQAEAVKIAIGSAIPGAAAAATTEVTGRDLTTGMIRRTTVSSDAVAHALERPLAQIVDAAKGVLDRTPPQLAADIAASGLTLVGGGALLPGLGTLLEQQTGLAVSIPDEPLLTVALGAGQALDTFEPRKLDRRRRGRR